MPKPRTTLVYQFDELDETHEGRDAMDKSVSGYCKIRFVSKYHHGATAGLILHAETLKGKTIADLSRYFPVGECNKMDRLERSPFFATWDEAFAYTFK